MTVIPLPINSGGKLANVNRWRDQIKLKPIDAEQLKKDAKEDKVGALAATYVKLVGADNSILGFMVERGNQVWFFKMTGPKELVEKQEAAFVDFCRSVEF